MKVAIRFALVGLAAIMLCACGSSGVENASLLSQPLAGGKARLKIVRAAEFAASMRGARVKLDGKEVADLGTGAAIILDVSAGSHELVVDLWDHPNVYKMALNAKSKVLYTLEVSTRDEAVIAGMFGGAAMLAEAAANENGGVFKIRVVSETPIKG